jgi:hypothetical protein
VGTLLVIYLSEINDLSLEATALLRRRFSQML